MVACKIVTRYKLAGAIGSIRLLKLWNLANATGKMWLGNRLAG